MEEPARLLLDILWSDPAQNDSVMGIHANTQRGGEIVKFGADRVLKFCSDNDIDLIIRAHEVVS